MGKNKLKKYREVAEFSNVIYLGDDIEGQRRFKNFCSERSNITLELGCGKGDFSVELAKMHPEKSFIGIDIKGERLWSGAKKALDSGIKNLLFLRMRIDLLDQFFEENIVDEIWITFPDPYVKRPRKNEDKRLSSSKFLEIYKKILKKDSLIHLKTDDKTLYNFTLDTIEKRQAALHRKTPDLYNSEYLDPELSIKTAYERKYLKENKHIRYISFSL